MTKAELLKALEAFGDDEKIYIWQNGILFGIDGVTKDAIPVDGEEIITINC